MKAYLFRGHVIVTPETIRMVLAGTWTVRATYRDLAQLLVLQGDDSD